MSWLAVEAGGGRYLLPLGQAGEIFPWSALQPVPYTQAWFLGVANLRGGLFGVIDLAAFVGADLAEQPAAKRSDQALSDASLLAVNAAMEVNAALLVDRLAGLRGIEAFTASEESAASAPAYFGTAYTDANGLRWQEIDLQTLSQQSAFLSITA